MNVLPVMLALSVKTLARHRGTVVSVESVATVAKEIATQSVEVADVIQDMQEEIVKKLVDWVIGDRVAPTVVIVRTANRVIL